MIFTKMQLNGNDFIFVNSLSSKIKIYQNLVSKLCDRRFGVGADGVVKISLSDKADCKLEIYNSDGSKANICGNVLLLLGRYLFELENFNIKNLDTKNLNTKNLDIKNFRVKNQKLKNKLQDIGLDEVNLNMITVETDAGIKEIYLNTEYDEVKSVFVNMGRVEELSNEIDMGQLFNNFEDKIKNNLKNNFENINFLLVGNGNFHIVITVKNIDSINIQDIVENIIKKNEENLELSSKYNIEFMQIIDQSKVKIKIFERGVGKTLSCGSGACACAFVAAKSQLNKIQFSQEDENKFQYQYKDEKYKAIETCIDKTIEVVVRSDGGEHKVKLLPNFDIIISGKPEVVYSGCLKW